jgi:hypothetical protein
METRHRFKPQSFYTIYFGIDQDQCLSDRTRRDSSCQVGKSSARPWKVETERFMRVNRVQLPFGGGHNRGALRQQKQKGLAVGEYPSFSPSLNSSHVNFSSSYSAF